MVAFRGKTDLSGLSLVSFIQPKNQTNQVDKVNKRLGGDYCLT